MILLDHTVQILILTVGGLLAVNLAAHRYPQGGLARRVTLAVLGLLALLSVFAYLRFGRLQDYGRFGRHTYHYHDAYHYAFGAKYFRELGYFGLYDATWVAFDELEREEGVRTPARFIPTVRSLASVFTVKPVADLRRTAPEVRARFTPARWAEFRGDLQTLLDLGWEVSWWRTMLFDLGFNPPPSWVVVCGTLANAIPFTPTSFELFPFLDLTLIVAGGGLLVLRAFGPAAAFAYVILFGNNFFASYAWTGGSFCRQPWLFLLTAGVACLKLDRPRWAGALLGAAAAFRVFPVLFLAGGAIALGAEALRDRSRRRAAVEYLLAAAAVAAALVAVSLLVFGLDPWRDFLAKISQHNRIFWVMHVGFPRLAAWAPGIERQNFWYEEGLVRFVAWQGRLEAIRAGREPWVTLVQAAATLGALGLAPRLRAFQAALVVGGTLLFCWAMPANYYYIYLALFPVVFFSERGSATDVLRVGLPFALLVGMALCPLASTDHIVQNALLNALVAAFFGLLLLSLAWDERAALAGRLRRLGARAPRSPPAPAAPDPA